MPPWDQTGVPGDVALTHFHSSTISGSASTMIARTFASVFPRQSPSSLIRASMIAEAESIGMLLIYIQASFSLMYSQFLAPNLAAISAACNLTRVKLDAWAPMSRCPDDQMSRLRAIPAEQPGGSSSAITQ